MLTTARSRRPFRQSLLQLLSELSLCLFVCCCCRRRCCCWVLLPRRALLCWCVWLCAMNRCPCSCHLNLLLRPTADKCLCPRGCQWRKDLTPYVMWAVRVHLPRRFRIFKNFCAFALAALAAFRTSCHSLLLTFPFHQLSLPRSFQPWCRFCFGFVCQLGRPVVLTSFASSHTFQSLESEAELLFSRKRDDVSAETFVRLSLHPHLISSRTPSF